MARARPITDGHFPLVSAEDGAHHVGDLAEGGLGADGGKDRSHDVHFSPPGGFDVAKGGSPLLLLESGDFLFKGKPRTDEEAGSARAKAGLILRVYRKMGYDAVLPDGADFASGLSFLKGKEGAEVPFTCLNFVSGREKAVWRR